MLKRPCRRKRGKKARGLPEELQPQVVVRKKADKPHSAFYKSGPLLSMPDLAEANPESLQNIKKRVAGQEDKKDVLPTIADIKGRGSPAQDNAKATSVDLEGLTEANFDGGSFETQNVQVRPAESCDSCSEQDPCVHVTGVLVSRFHVTTAVTLPSVADYPDLTPCQQQRVQQAITNVLAPHEQEHVQAFGQYNGVVRTPFDLTLCRSEFDSTIQGMFNDLESGRRQSAQDASDALDPFNFSVDIDCEEPEDESSGQSDTTPETESVTGPEPKPEPEPEPENEDVDAPAMQESENSS